MLKFIQNCWHQDKERRFLWLPVLYALGISLYFALPKEPSKWLTLTLIETLILLAILFRHRINILYTIGIFAIILAGFTTVQIKAIWLDTSQSKLPNETFYFRGRIDAIDTNFQGRKRLILENLTDFDGNRYVGRYRITLRGKNNDASVGDCVEMVGKIMPLSKEVVIGGYQFDRKGYFEGLKGSGYAESRWFQIECPMPSPKKITIYTDNLRQSIVNHIKSILAPDKASIASAIIAGERGGIDETQYEQYRNSGLAHFLSISGLHMSMLAGLMFFLIRFILSLIPAIALRFDTKKVASVFAIILSFIYLLISGNAVSAQRAFIMTFIVLLGVLTNRRAISMYTISLAAFIVLFLSPEALVSASFQMSFAAVLGLVAFYEKVSCKMQNFINVASSVKWFRIILLYIIGIVVSDFIASLMTLPFAVYHFNMISIYTTLGNFLAGPIIGLIIMPTTLLSMLLMPFGADTMFLRATGWGINLLNQITSWVSSLPNAGYQVSSMPHWGLILIVIGGLWLMLWQCKWRYLGLLAILIGAFSITTVDVPDILISPQAKVIAFKNHSGKLELVSSRGGRFVKDIWQNKYPVSERKTVLKEHPELKISDSKIIFQGHSLNIDEDIGYSIYNTATKPIIKTIRQDIGYRLWNK